MWTDTAEFRNPHYHRPTDTPETLDYDFLAGVTGLLVHAALSGGGVRRHPSTPGGTIP